MARSFLAFVVLAALALPAAAQELANLRIGVDAEPGTARTEALLALLRTRFTRVELGVRWNDEVIVLDRAPAEPAAPPTRDAIPHVVLGAAIPRAVAAFGLLGAASAPPIEGPTERRDPGAVRAGPPIDSTLFADGHAALAAPLLDAPEAAIAIATRDAEGRSLALVWHQGRFVCFGPGASTDALGAEWSDVLLRCVAFAGGFTRHRGDAISHPPGADDADVPGRDPAAHDSVRRTIAELDDEDPGVRERARRWLARHVEGGLDRYASESRWRSWSGELEGQLVYCPSDHRWRIDETFWDGQRHVRARGAWQRADAFRGGRSSHAVDPSMEAHVPGRGGPPSPLRVPFVWSFPPATAADALAKWLVQARPVDERESILHNIAELGPDARRAAPRVVEWFEANSGSPLVVMRVLATAGPDFVEPLLDAAALAEDVGRRTPSGLAGMPFAFTDALSVLAHHPAADAALFGRLARAADDAQLAGRTTLATALLATLASPQARPDASWIAPLDALVGRWQRSPDREPWMDELLRALGRHGDPRWIDPILVRELAPDERRGRFDDAWLTALTELGAAGVERFVDIWRASEPARRAWLAANVDAATLLSARTADAWFASEEGAELAAHALVLPRPRDEGWLGALAATAAGEDEATALIALEALARAYPDERGWRHVEPLLAHASVWRRRAAVHAVAAFLRDEPPAEDALLAATHDEDPWVRATALWALREPVGDADPAVVERLREAADGSAHLAPLARHALYRRTVGPAPLVAAVHALREPIDLGVASDDLDSGVHVVRWNTALRLAAELGADDWTEERLLRAEHELHEWFEHVHETVLTWDEGGGDDTTRLVARLGEGALLALERRYPYEWRGSAFAFGGHMGVSRAMGAEGWPVLASLVWCHGARLDLQVLSWPREVESGPRIAPLFAQRLAHAVLVGSLGSDGGRGATDRALRRWMSLGDAGRDALAELQTHPAAAVREEATALLARWRDG